MPRERFRVLVVGTCPVPHNLPFFRRVAKQPRCELHAAYRTLCEAEAAFDPDFSTTIQGDIPRVDGYCRAAAPHRKSRAPEQNIAATVKATSRAVGPVHPFKVSST